MKLTLDKEDYPKVNIQVKNHLTNAKKKRDRGQKHRYMGGSQEEMDKWTAQGIAAECAIAKWLGLPWGGDKWDGADVGYWIQVKWVNDPTDRLLVQPKLEEEKRDVKSFAYVLVEGKAPEFEMVGWLGGDSCCARPLRQLQKNGNLIHVIERSELRTDFEVLEAIGLSGPI